MDNISNKKIIFMGTPAFAEEILTALLENNYQITSVFTQPDKKVGRRQEIKKSPVKITAQKHNLLIFQPEKLDETVQAEIEKQNPDLIIVAAYGKIIPSSILAMPLLGAINVHPSLLPKFRGPSPIQNALLAGEIETGTTIMLMDKGIDTGAILSQERLAISPNDIDSTLEKKLVKLSLELLLKTLPLWLAGKIIPQKQDDSRATLCQLIEKNDGKIIWSEDAAAIFNRYRALNPWPGIFTFWGTKRLKLNQISFNPDQNETAGKLGEVLKIGERVGVQTGAGIIFLEEVQLEGKGNMRIENFIHGYGNFIGSELK